jgi:hypothetical protein
MKNRKTIVQMKGFADLSPFLGLYGCHDYGNSYIKPKLCSLIYRFGRNVSTIASNLIKTICYRSPHF